MDKTIIVMCARSQGKTVLMNKLMEELDVVTIDETTGTNVHRRDITFEIKNNRDPDEIQHEIVKKENPYQNGGLRKKGKGGYRKY